MRWDQQNDNSAVLLHASTEQSQLVLLKSASQSYVHGSVQRQISGVYSHLILKKKRKFSKSSSNLLILLDTPTSVRYQDEESSLFLNQFIGITDTSLPGLSWLRLEEFSSSGVFPSSPPPMVFHQSASLPWTINSLQPYHKCSQSKSHSESTFHSQESI